MAADGATLRPLGLAIAGMALVAAMDATVKALGTHFPVVEILFLRFLVAAMWLALYIAVRRQSWPRRKDWRQHLLRALSLGATAFLFFTALTRLPLALATAIVMTGPIYVVVFGRVLLKEELRPRLIGATGLAVLGSLVIVFGNTQVSLSGGGDPIGWLAALAAPVTYALTVVLMKTHSSTDTPASISFAQSALIAALVLPIMTPSFIMPGPGHLPLIVLAGFLGAAGYLLFVSGLSRLPASLAGLADYTTLLWAALWGFLFFAEIPGLPVWIGGAMIIGGCWLITRRGSAKPVPVEPTQPV